MRPGLALLLLAACTQDISVKKDAVCDGELQTGEDPVDAPFDRDGDGYLDADNPDCVATYGTEGLDCDDGNADVHPGQTEIPCNGVDDDCDPGTIDSVDADGDGSPSCEDCDDDDGTAFPGNVEVECDLVDNDCDPETADGLDQDGDGVSVCEDCNDLSPKQSPDRVEEACNDIDDDCDDATSDTPDGDGDGVDACDDCDDGDAAILPGGEEVCDNLVDDDCDGDIDEECDYSGLWVLDDKISYSCAFGVVTLNVQKLDVTDAYPIIDVEPNPFASQPGLMTGSFSTDVTFEASNTIAGTCTETYTVAGTFVDAHTLTGSLSAEYTGGKTWCFDCTNQSWIFTATR